MAVEADEQGRIHLPPEVRKKYGEQFHLVTYDDRLERIPIADDPLTAVRDEFGDAHSEKSRDELQKGQSTG
jgi:bifunctional DNA-binding transcriptional regulator/antitoxin component of YhaV-PrlF toxin-antitoxin module